jgi:hypothetical protein
MTKVNVIERVRSFLQIWGKLTGVPVLAVGITSLVVASLSLLVSFCNYQRLVASDRPLYAILNPTFLHDDHSRALQLYWNNVGKKTARNGKAKLFGFGEDGKRGDQLGESEMTGPGTTIVAGGAAQSVYDLDKPPTRLLICAKYFDDDERAYEQAFVLLFPEKPSPFPNATHLDEEKTPDLKVCQR